MQAAVFNETHQPLTIETRENRSPASGEVVVEIRAAGLNRRDYWITQGLYPDIRCPVVLGSDGAGVVSQLGENVDPDWLGREVVLTPSLGWGPNPEAQGPDFNILGMPRDGTFATEITISAMQLHAKPSHLTFEQAAALPLAGLTAYRALFTQGGAAEGQRILITGAGGGVATFAILFAKVIGAETLVTSSSSLKIDRAKQLGARVGYNYKDADWTEQLQSDGGPVDLVIDGAGGAGLNQLLDILKPGGHLVSYGSTTGPVPKLDIFKIFWKQLHIIGCTMGSPDDFNKMLGLVNDHQITPVIDQTFDLADVNDALATLAGGEHFGNVVLLNL